MKKSVKIILGIVAALIIAGVIYWEYNKKRIIKNAVENAVSGKTDSVYFIHYDSSKIDAITGSASFYNVSLQSDSLQKQMLQFDTASSKIIFNVHVAEVSIHGTDIPSLLGNRQIDANSIKLVRPMILIMEPGIKNDNTFNRDDTLALYEKMLGKFRSIHAGEIIIEDGLLNVSHKMAKPYITVSGINIHIKNVLIDSTKNYDNVLGYFIKDMVATIKKADIDDSATNTSLHFSDMEYDAGRRVLKLGKFMQKNDNSGKIVFDINNTSVTGLNTDSFILEKQLKADELLSDGGLMTFYSKQKKPGGNDAIEIDNSFFNEAQLNKIVLNSTKVVVYKQSKPNESPFILTNARFSASDIQKIYSGTSVRNIIGKSNWNIAADGFSLISKDKVYQFKIGPFSVNKANETIHTDYFHVKPLITKEVFVKRLKEQKEMYDIEINGIDLTGVDIKKLLTDSMLIAENAIIHPVIKIFLDRTIPPYSGSKVGNYPHQLVRKINFQVYVKKIDAKNAYIEYTERSALTGKPGTIFFNNANGTIKNFTNINDYIKKDNLLTVNATARLLNATVITTEWKLPLNTSNGAFVISGNTHSFPGNVLNPLFEPLSLASFKRGEIKSIDFTMSGNDNEAKGTSTLLYNDLKIEALKKDSNEVKKREVISFIANLIVRNNNPSNGVTRKGEIDVKRDTTRSFFNLVWQGIFKASKRTVLGKNDEK